MEHYDVVVIGAGPAGSFAAKTAAENGLRVLLLEEHSTIGIPCHDTGWLIGADFTEEVIDVLKNKIFLRRVKGFKLHDAITGDLLENVDKGRLGYLTPRATFDKELTKLAINSGANLLLNTRAISLLNEGGKVVGVATSHDDLPNIRSEITICAFGAASLKSRIAIPGSKEQFHAGILVELTDVKGFENGVVEIHKTSDPTTPPNSSFWPLSEETCYSSFSNLSEFEALKSRNEVAFSRKIAQAKPVQVFGYIARSKGGGIAFDRIIGDGVMYVGESAGASGTIHSMIMGHYAGVVASRAIRDDDVSFDSLLEYQKKFQASDIYKSPFCWLDIEEYYGSYGKCLAAFQKIRV